MSHDATNILKEIVARKKQDLIKEKEMVLILELKEAIKTLENDNSNLPFYKALNKKDLTIIGEVKKASPSKGIFKENFNPLEIAKELSPAVDCLSVLTEKNYFLGADENITKIKAEINLPVLCKDFIIDEYQIYKAKVLGADCILLIVAILSEEQLSRYLNLSRQIGLDCLVEVHDEVELNKAMKYQSKIIGINNRDLTTFKTNVDTTNRLIEKISEEVIVVSESGFLTGQDTCKLNKRVKGILVGESFMKAEDMIVQGRALRDGFNQHT